MNMTPRHSRAQPYRCYLLRLWQAEAGVGCWHASLEDPRTGDRVGFATLEHLFAFLMDHVEGDGRRADKE
jgi:hypothetical protein